jgi:hypothetical protein
VSFKNFSCALAETPWLNDAKSEGEEAKLATLFDLDK